MSTQQQPSLFDEDPSLALTPPPVAAPAPPPGVARVLMPNRTQLELRPCDLEALLPAGHRARLVWGWVMRADLSGMYALIRAVEGGSGRTPIAPERLFALWLYATLEGVGSARAVARLTQEHDAYRWICGGVQVNYHTVADFRTAHGEALDALLTDSVAALLAAGAVTLKRVAQEGIRARAGAASFRRGETLERCLEEARAPVEASKRQGEDDPGAVTRRQQRPACAGRERQARIEQAFQRLPELAEIKTKQGKKAETARAATTDPEAPAMKRTDGGYRPAYNGQFVSDTASPVIVGMAAVTAGTDMAQLTPMIEQVSHRYAQQPATWLVDDPAHAQRERAAESSVV